MGNFLASLNGATKNLTFQVKKHSPEILVGLGLASSVVALFFVRKAAKKEDVIIDEAKAELAEIQEKKEHPESRGEGCTEQDLQKETARVYVRMGGRLVALYAPAIFAEAAAICSILGGCKILNNRNAAIASALAISASDFEEYRKKLIEKFGDEGEKIDKELRYGIKEVEVKEKEVDEDGKTKTVKKKIFVLENPNGDFDGYRRIFDSRNGYWDHTPCYNTFFLGAKQSKFNDKLRADGYVFLNDVLVELGFERTRVGQEVGWIYDPNRNVEGDNYIDFRVTPVRLIINDGEVEGMVPLEHEEHNCAYLLDFNVDGSILNKADWPDKEV